MTAARRWFRFAFSLRTPFSAVTVVAIAALYSLPLMDEYRIRENQRDIERKAAAAPNIPEARILDDAFRQILTGRAITPPPDSLVDQADEP
jgi:hypothetical protein